MSLLGSYVTFGAAEYGSPSGSRDSVSTGSFDGGATEPIWFEAAVRVPTPIPLRLVVVWVGRVWCVLWLVSTVFVRCRLRKVVRVVFVRLGVVL